MRSEKIEYIKNFLFRVNEDIAVIENLVRVGTEHYTSSVCFHAQQATEKFLKLFLVYHDVDFPRTHDLDFLLIECKKINKEAFQVNLKNLTDFGITVRYADDFYVPDKNEALEYQEIAVHLKEIVEGLINKKFLMLR